MSDISNRVKRIPILDAQGSTRFLGAVEKEGVHYLLHQDIGREQIYGVAVPVPILQGQLVWYQDATVALLQVEGGSVRFLSYGTEEVTATTGIVLLEYTVAKIYSHRELSKVSIIADSGTPKINLVFENNS